MPKSFAVKFVLYVAAVSGWPLFLYSFAELSHTRMSASTYAAYAGRLKAVADFRNNAPVFYTNEPQSVPTGANSNLISLATKDNSYLGRIFVDAYNERVAKLLRKAGSDDSRGNEPRISITNTP